MSRAGDRGFKRSSGKYWPGRTSALPRWAERIAMADSIEAAASRGLGSFRFNPGGPQSVILLAEFT